MYIPTRFRQTDPTVIREFIEAHSFAMVISNCEPAPHVTHVPVIIASQNAGDDGADLELCFHVARSNPQVQLLTGRPCTIVFQGPHAYISPMHYEAKASVPTWNYVSVHVNGSAVEIVSELEYEALMRRTIEKFDRAYIPQWLALPDEYRTRMQKQTAMFRLRANSVHACEKLSQNKTAAERNRIATQLQEDTSEAAREIGVLMAQLGM